MTADDPLADIRGEIERINAFVTFRPQKRRLNGRMTSVRIAVALLGSAGGLGAASASAAETFPVRGTYEIVSVYAGQERHFQEYVDASTREAFDKFLRQVEGANRCRNRQAQIGGGSFRSSAICDAPDGDFRNIQVENAGSYSSSSFTYSFKMNLFGRWAVQKVDARLIRAR